MNRFKMSTLMLFLSAFSYSLLMAQDCDPTACSEKLSSTGTAPSFAQLSSYQGAPKKATFTFPAGKVIEVALFSIKPGQEKVLGQDYFPKVFPVAGEYGLTTSQTFTVVEHAYGEAPVQQLGFFVWDSYEQKEKFNKDPRYLKLRNIRNKAIDFLYMGYFQVEKDITYTFDDQSVYDFAALWIVPEEAPKLSQYFEKVAPVATTAKYGYEPILTLNPLSNCTSGKYTPSLIGFARWAVPDGFARLQSNTTYQKYVHLRDEATPYKDVMMVKANIQ